MKVPTAMPPDQIGAMVDMLLGDLPELDPNHALSVTPSGFDPGAASTQYFIRYWVSDYRGLAASLVAASIDRVVDRGLPP